MLFPHKLILPLILIASVVPAVGETIYVIGSSGHFGTVDVATGAFNPIGPVLTTGSQGLVPGSGGLLLSLDFNGNLITIDPATGIASTIGPTGLADCSQPPISPCGPNSANSVASANGQLYATDFDNNLYSVNQLTGAATLIGSTGISAVPFIPGSTNPDGSFNFFDEALFGANGSLYATFDTGTFNPSTFAVTEITGPQLYRIDPASGVATLVGPTQFAVHAVAAVNGTYYGFDVARSKIITLDLSTGASTDVGDFDPALGIVSGAAAIPEPGTAALAALGLAGLAFRRRLRRSDRLN